MSFDYGLSVSACFIRNLDFPVLRTQVCVLWNSSLHRKNSRPRSSLRVLRSSNSFCGIRVFVSWNSSLHQKNQGCVSRNSSFRFVEFKFAFSRIQVFVFWNRFKSLLCGIQVCVLWIQVCVLWNQVCIEWIKFAIQKNQDCTERIKFLFQKNQVCIERIKFALQKNQVCIEWIKFLQTVVSSFFTGIPVTSPSSGSILAAVISHYYQDTRPNRKSASSEHTLSGPQKTDSGLLMHYQPYSWLVLASSSDGF